MLSDFYLGGGLSLYLARSFTAGCLALLALSGAEGEAIFIVT